ncbi:MAG TPA: glycosyltransferase 87 family protein [Candidatus Nanopelagicales bacterium]
MSRSAGFHAWVVRQADRVWEIIDILVGTDAPWARTRRPTVVGWVVTRAVMLLLLFSLERTIINDVLYYGAGMAQIGPDTPVAAVLREYPTPVLALLAVPRLLSGGNLTVYVGVFIAMILAFDALFTALLRRRSGARPGVAVALWLVAGPVLGPIALTRFDVIPGLAAGAAILILGSRPRTAGALVAVGAAVKLWPAILIPVLAAPARTRLRVLTGAVVTGIVVVVASLAVAGWDRLLSPLNYQADRGLQIESIAALPLMVIWSVAHNPWQITFSKFITSEISGPGASAISAVTTLATAVVAVFLVVLWWRAWRRRPQLTAAQVGWLMLAVTTLFILTNKVFSPQYLLWLSPVAVATIACSPRSDLAVRRWTVLLVVDGLITQGIYPNSYVLVITPAWYNPIGVALLVLRDVLLVGLTWYAVRRAWQATAAGPLTTDPAGGDEAGQPSDSASSSWSGSVASSSNSSTPSSSSSSPSRSSGSVSSRSSPSSSTA